MVSTLITASPGARAASAPVEVTPGIAVRTATTGETFFDATVAFDFDGTSSTLALRSDGTGPVLVDDVIDVTVTRPDGTTRSLTHDFSNSCTPLVSAGPFELSALMKNGTNQVRVRLRDRCGTYVSSTALWVAPLPAAPRTGTLAWGSNFNFTLGDGSSTNRSLPVPISLPSSTIALSAGRRHGLALTGGGQVYAWGENFDGQLGFGDTVNRSAPTLMPLTDIVDISASTNTSYALRRDGTVLGWGSNYAGQVGDGSFATRRVPVQVAGLGPGSGVVKVVAGAEHALALRANGAVVAWGSNDDGELGDGTLTSRTTPVPVLGLGPGSGVVKLAAGDGHNLALLSTGTVLAWGANYLGQLGDGTLTDRRTPVPLYLSKVVSVETRVFSSFALRSDGGVYGWGSNTWGQLGYPAGGSRSTPREIPLLGPGSGVISLAPGERHVLAAKSDGTVIAWGQNGAGQLGDGTVSASIFPYPRHVAGIAPGEALLDLSAAHFASFVVMRDHGLDVSPPRAPVGTTFTISGVCTAPSVVEVAIFDQLGMETYRDVTGTGGTGGFGVDVNFDYPSRYPGRYTAYARCENDGTTITGSFAVTGHRFIALGDSYSSGEGNPPFLPDGTGSSKCARSLKAFSALTAQAAGMSYLNLACSGGETDDLTTSYQHQGIPPQIDELRRISAGLGSTEIVTLTVGGNDLGFGPILSNCVLVPGPCWYRHNADVYSKMANLESPANPDRLSSIYQRIRAAAGSQARVVVLGYPMFFAEGGYPFRGRCQNILNSDILSMNKAIRDLNSTIQREAGIAGVEYVDTKTVFGDHFLCSVASDDWVHGLDIIPQCGCLAFPFHPNDEGHGAIAGRLAEHLGTPRPTVQIHPGEQFEEVNEVIEDTLWEAFWILWPGSDVELTLVSPSGRVIRRTTVASDIRHTRGPDYESYVVKNPEPGPWTMRIYGLDVPPEGEPVTFFTHSTPADDVPPVTTITRVPSVDWTQSDVAVSIDSTDDSSGVATLLYSAAGAHTAGPVTVDGASASFVVSSEGVTEVIALATDAAGNSEAGTIVSVGIDRTPPTLAGRLLTQPNQAGWHREDVVVRWDCSDQLSGVATCPPDTKVAAEGRDLSASASASDVAGNEASASFSPINIDRTRATAAVTPTQLVVRALGGLVAGTASDALSGVSSVEVLLVNELTGAAFTLAAGCVCGGNEATWTADAAQVQPGRYRVLAVAPDVAGNPGAPSPTERILII